MRLDEAIIEHNKYHLFRKRAKKEIGFFKCYFYSVKNKEKLIEDKIREYIEEDYNKSSWEDYK